MIAMGRHSFVQWLDGVIRHLGPYKMFLGMTCRFMYKVTKRFPKLPAGNIFTNTLITDGHLGLLELCYQHEWRFVEEIGTSHVPVAKFLLERGITNGERCFFDACFYGDFKMIDYCIEMRYFCSCWSDTDLVEVLDYCYREKKLPVGKESRWMHDSAYACTEDMLLWCMHYQHEEAFSFEWFRSHPDDFEAMLYHWNDHRFANFYMMRQIFWMGWDRKTPIDGDLCQQMTWHMSQVIPSHACQCKNPQNHQLRARPTKKLKK